MYNHEKTLDNIIIEDSKLGSTVVHLSIGASTAASVVTCTRPLFLWFVSFGGAIAQHSLSQLKNKMNEIKEMNVCSEEYLCWIVCNKYNLNPNSTYISLKMTMQNNFTQHPLKIDTIRYKMIQKHTFLHCPKTNKNKPLCITMNTAHSGAAATKHNKITANCQLT